MKPGKKVIVRFSALGDVTLTTGVLKHWHNKYGWRFVVLTRKSQVDIFKGHPAVDEVVGLEKSELAFPNSIKKFKMLAQRYHNCDLIDLHDTLRTRLLSALWQGNVLRYNKLGVQRRLFLFSGHRLCESELLEHNVPQRYALAVDKITPEPLELLPCIFIDEKEENNAKKLLAECGASSTRPLIAIHPYATHPQKSWPRNLWLDLLEILESLDLPWFAIGQNDNPALTLPSFSGLGFDFTNKTSLRETCALIKQANVLITGDSGPMHLGCAVGTPVLALFGPTTRHWGFFPAGKKDHVLEASTSGRPYSLHGKSSDKAAEECMQTITVEMVLNELKLML